jgi:hypothetical protein
MTAGCERVTGNTEVISSSAGLVTKNALVLTGLATWPSVRSERPDRDLMVGLGDLEPPTSPLSGLRDWKIMQHRTRFGVALLRRFACEARQRRLA